ncbi:AAA family ATPase [Wohlfahrtiimonas chitiniclastica]|uniref:AAA family ATPase n=1 Tax=Wohlfahrtiimonas chitiniclastica TaxID=400946 RepID=UPI001BCE9FBF|nr:AAA family ATPase [Wohlfahrtiimonas chitiniclastica]MBS7819003.1 AAA family ATPase [Wohlfahrtiimonas chitiniclastica]
MTRGENSARDNGYENNKDVVFDHIQGIYIENFRTIKNQQIKLGRYLTLITGKNGTMKSSLLGLIAHPFSSSNNAKDVFGNPLKTQMTNVFKLSHTYDAKCDYLYYLQASTNKNIKFEEPVRMYERIDPTTKKARFRITVSKSHDAGLGNFLLNTSFINLKRLYPIIDTNAKIKENDNGGSLYSSDEAKWIGDAYYKILQRKSFRKTDAIEDTNIKATQGPKESYYDFQSISSGEDNLGSILNKMLAFMSHKSNDATALNGIFCIDEVEASLHPVSQIFLIQFLYDWAKQYNVQVVVTTHSLHVIQYCLNQQEVVNKQDKDFLVVNNISTMGVKENDYNIVINPTYEMLYKELTYKSPIQNKQGYKVNIICEDTIAKEFITQILIGQSAIKASIEYLLNIGDEKEGDSYKGLISLALNGKKILADSIIILDPDVSEKSFTRCDTNYLFKIPDIDTSNYPIERRVIVYLYNLDGDHDIFSDNEKLQVESTFAKYNIDPSDSNNKNIKSYKSWVKDNKSLYNKALKLYIAENKHVFREFINELVEKINLRRGRYSLPLIAAK